MLKLLSIHGHLKKTLETQEERQAVADTQGFTLPLSSDEVSLRMSAVKELYPGLRLQRADMPSQAYFGVLEGVRQEQPYASGVPQGHHHRECV